MLQVLLYPTLRFPYYLFFFPCKDRQPDKFRKSGHAVFMINSPQLMTLLMFIYNYPSFRLHLLLALKDSRCLLLALTSSYPVFIFDYFKGFEKCSYDILQKVTKLKQSHIFLTVILRLLNFGRTPKR